MRRIHAGHFNHLRHIGRWGAKYSQGLWAGGIQHQTADNLVSAYLHGMPFLNLVNRHITEIGCHVYSPRLTYIRFGVYEDNGYKYPGKLIADFGEIYCSQGDHWLTGLDVLLAKNKIYWAAHNISGASTSVFTVCYHHYQFLETHFNMMAGSIRVAQAYGALPDPFPGGATGFYNIVPMLMR
jgi:hypothetical protein